MFLSRIAVGMGLPYACSMTYHTPRPIDAVKALRHAGKPAFVREMARTAAVWDFNTRVPVPVVSMESLVSGDQEIRLRLGSGQFGETPVMDLVVLSILVAQARPAVLFEFGTFTGLGTLHLALNSPASSIVHTLDLQPDERHSITGLAWESEIEQSTIGSLYRAVPDVDARVRQHWGDSRHFDTTELQGTVDFIFIDAAHSYEFVHSDTEKAIALASPGATVVWHDYNRVCPDVQRVVAEQTPRFAPIAIADTSIALMRLPSA
jgi:predicted O-methyltransferase YrrM